MKTSARSNHIKHFLCNLLFKATTCQIRTIATGNTNWRGRLCTVYLLIKIVCFVKKVNKIFFLKSSCSKLDSTRRWTVLSLPHQWGFPDLHPSLIFTMKTKTHQSGTFFVHNYKVEWVLAMPPNVRQGWKHLFSITQSFHLK